MTAVAKSELLALDPHAAERAELRASGIAQHTIDALYPQDFDDLVPSLLKIVKQGSASDLRDLGASQQQVNMIMYAREIVLREDGSVMTKRITRSHAQAYDQALKDSALLSVLLKTISLRITASLPASYSQTEANTQGYSEALVVVKIIWCTHWFMVHRAELPAEHQQITDELVDRVNKALRLSPQNR